MQEPQEPGAGALESFRGGVRRAALPGWTGRSIKPLKWWMLALIGLLAVAVYASSLDNQFAFDDVGIVQNNAHVQNLDWLGIWKDNYWPNTEGIMPDALYRPLTLWSYLANQAITPNFPWAFHLVNVLLHALVCVLVAILTWRIIGDHRVAVVAGILFAVHPLHTEAVANTVGRAELLAALWTLLALLVYLPVRPLTEEIGPRRRGAWHGLVVAACFLAAILSKETPVTFLGAIVLLDLWRWARWPRINRPGIWRWMAGQAWRYYLPLWGAFGIYMALRIPACGLTVNVHVIHRIVNPLVAASIGERIVTPFLLFAKYLWLTIWPVHLSADYSAPSILPVSNPFAPLPLIGLLVCLLAGISAVHCWRRRPQVTLLIGLFFTAYILVANFLRIGTIFGERLFYSPSIFVVILAAWGIVWFMETLLERRKLLGAGAAAAAMMLAVGAMMHITWVRNTDWANNTTLAIATGRDNPESGKACSWAGSVLVLSDKPGLVQFGVVLLQRAAELTPDYVTPKWELAKYYGRRGDLGNSAIYFALAARLDPGSQITHKAMVALIKDLHKADPSTYMPTITAYEKAHPEEEAIYFALAMVYDAQGKLADAEASCQRALTLAAARPVDGILQFHEAGAELAAIKIERGNIDGGLNDYRIYTSILHSSAQAHCTFAAALLGLDPVKYPTAYLEADLNLQLAQNLDPTNAEIRELRGRLIALRRAPPRPGEMPADGHAAQLTDVKPAKDDAPVHVPGGAKP